MLEVSQFWRKVVIDVAKQYPDIQLEHMLVDNAAMQMVLRPTQFDVMLTENTFGDILSDVGGILAGSIGMLPSASLGEKKGLYEPVHGSAPDIAGQNKANPLGAIGSVAAMLEYTFGLMKEADGREQRDRQSSGVRKGHRRPETEGQACDDHGSRSKQ